MSAHTDGVRVEITVLHESIEEELTAALSEVERLRAELATERAAVVAWLRKPCDAHYFAAAIEAGTHRAGGAE